MFLFNKNWQSCIGYRKVPFQNIEHGFSYPVKLTIFTTEELTMKFISIFMNVFIKNSMEVSEIWMCLCYQMEAEYYPCLLSTTFRDKGDYDKPTEGGYIQTMRDLVYCSNIATLFHIFLCLGQLLGVTPFQREIALQILHDTCNLCHLHSEGMYQHSHM